MFDETKPFFIKKMFAEQKTGNTFPAGDRPYRLEAIPEKFRTPEYLTQEAIAVEKAPDYEQVISVKPLPAPTEPTINITSSSVIIKESQLPPSPEVSSPPPVVVADAIEVTPTTTVKKQR